MLVDALHIEVTGKGPPLVLLHGWAMHGGIFAPLVAQLTTQRTLYVVDLPGHGHSRSSAVSLAPENCARAILEAVPAAPWCGWSLGGLIALQAALLAPQQVSKLAMLCATPKFVLAEDWPQGMSRDVFTGFEAGLRSDWRATIDRFIALEAFGSDQMREELKLLRDAVLERGEPSTRVLQEGLQVLESSDLREHLPALQVPSVWIAGRRDRLVNPQAMQASAQLSPNARYVQIEHAGHAPFLTHAQAVAEVLVGFLQKNEESLVYECNIV